MSMEKAYEIPYYPSQLEICFGERCNLDCDYCFVEKTTKEVLDFPTIRKAVDIFLSLPGDKKTVTFNSSEPFVHPELFKKTVGHILKKSVGTAAQINMVATTNGLAFNGKMRKLIASWPENFYFHFSLDGKAESHEKHRKSREKKPNFQTILQNFKAYPRKQNVWIIMTVVPVEAGLLEENIEFIYRQGFKKIDVFPEIFRLWKKEEMRKFRQGMAKVLERYKDVEFRLLNRLWGESDYSTVLLGADGRFYLFEWVLPLAHGNRKLFAVGDGHGLNLEKRKKVLEMLREKAGDMPAGFGKLNPLPLYLWCAYNKKNFNEYLGNFCELAGIIIKADKKNVQRKIQS